MSMVLYMMVLYECGNIMWYYMSVVISVSLRARGHACVESGSVCVRGRECLSQHVSNCLCFTHFLRKIVRVCSSVLPVCMCVSPCVCVCVFVCVRGSLHACVVCRV